MRRSLTIALTAALAASTVAFTPVGVTERSDDGCAEGYSITPADDLLCSAGLDGTLSEDGILTSATFTVTNRDNWKLPLRLQFRLDPDETSACRGQVEVLGTEETGWSVRAASWGCRFVDAPDLEPDEAVTGRIFDSGHGAYVRTLQAVFACEPVTGRDLPPGCQENVSALPGDLLEILSPEETVAVLVEFLGEVAKDPAADVDRIGGFVAAAAEEFGLDVASVATGAATRTLPGAIVETDGATMTVTVPLPSGDANVDAFLRAGRHWNTLGVGVGSGFLVEGIRVRDVSLPG